MQLVESLSKSIDQNANFKHRLVLVLQIVEQFLRFVDGVFQLEVENIKGRETCFKITTLLLDFLLIHKADLFLYEVKRCRLINGADMNGDI